MGTWLLILSCLGDPAVCNKALPWKEIRFGSQARCKVEGDGIIARNARTNPDDKIVITYSCRPFTEDDVKRADKTDKDDKNDKDGDGK
jgi:hypothetical protein